MSVPPMVSGKSNEHSYQDRVSTAHAALNMIISNNFIDTGSDEMLWTLCSQMAELDIITRNTTYREQVRNLLPTKDVHVFTYHGTIKYALLYGYAASKAYAAYQDESHLKMAQEIWDLAWTYFISEEVESKRIATKSLPLRNRFCTWPLLGGVFKTFNSTDGELDTTTAASFLTLSALLAESTSNVTYTKVATQVLGFLDRINFGFLGSDQEDIPIYGLEDNTTEACYRDNSTHKPQFIWYPTSGDVIEGLSILAPILDNLNASEIGYEGVHDVLQSTIQSETLFRKNQRSDGILDLGAGYVSGYPTGDPFLVRGLVTAYQRNHSIEMADYIKAFTDIQYNALLNKATIPGTNIYGGSWIGPPQQTFSFTNQCLAAMVLVQAINLAPSPTTTNISTSGIAPSTGSKKTGIIAGSIVGGVVFIFTLAGLIFVFLYKRKQCHQALSTPDSPPTHAITPFILSKRGELQPTKVIISQSKIQPVENLRENQRMDQPGVVASSGADNNEVDLHTRFQGISTAQMVRILNTRFESESLPPAYPQSQLSGGLQVINEGGGLA